MTDENKDTAAGEEAVENKKDFLVRSKEFMYALCKFIVYQTEHGKSNMRLIDGHIHGKDFKLEQVQYKNGKTDFIIHEYATDEKFALLGTAKNNLEKFYTLFENKIF